MRFNLTLDTDSLKSFLNTMSPIQLETIHECLLDVITKKYDDYNKWKTPPPLPGIEKTKSAIKQFESTIEIKPSISEAKKDYFKNAYVDKGKLKFRDLEELSQIDMETSQNDKYWVENYILVFLSVIMIIAILFILKIN